MNLSQVTLHHVKMRLLSPFQASYGQVQDREVIIVEATDRDGVTGWGECVAFSVPWYTEETVKTCWHILEDFLIPLLSQNSYKKMEDYLIDCSKYKRHNMAKASIEAALWDLDAKQKGVSLSSLWGGTRKEVEAGVVVGLGDHDQMIASIQSYLDEGYKRFKVKIKPGQDYDLLKKIRSAFPTLPLMADANSAYSLADVKRIKALDEFRLMMIEQPLSSDDIIDHATLQRQIDTPICLDESIVSFEDARKAIELGSCKIINIKMGRVGGFREAQKIHNLCQSHHIPIWCGGMLETGVSRAHNIALASLPQFQIPGDISASSRYWSQDIIQPEVKIENGKIQVPSEPGLGFEIDRKHLSNLTLYKQHFKIR
ncbi:o-succinylbenzoate synthase [Bacillus salitolerans]|uniref:o-succinylbenzoate synthase n=1 Tax=Bacillus salitolerans TaxID=1437434 RepID=A0ABW4LVH1_9BACI